MISLFCAASLVMALVFQVATSVSSDKFSRSVYRITSFVHFVAFVFAGDAIGPEAEPVLFISAILFVFHDTVTMVYPTEVRQFWIKG